MKVVEQPEGKQIIFPLKDEAVRADSEDGDIHNEEPLLLDPCEAADWKLLGCSLESGHPVPATDDADEQRRVKIFIQLYHLHQHALKKMRLTQIRNLDKVIAYARDRYDELDGSAKRLNKFKADRDR